MNGLTRHTDRKSCIAGSLSGKIMILFAVWLLFFSIFGNAFVAVYAEGEESSGTTAGETSIHETETGETGMDGSQTGQPDAGDSRDDSSGQKPGDVEGSSQSNPETGPRETGTSAFAFILFIITVLLLSSVITFSGLLFHRQGKRIAYLETACSSYKTAIIKLKEDSENFSSRLSEIKSSMNNYGGKNSPSYAAWSGDGSPGEYREYNKERSDMNRNNSFTNIRNEGPEFLKELQTHLSQSPGITEEGNSFFEGNSFLERGKPQSKPQSNNSSLTLNAQARSSSGSRGIDTATAEYAEAQYDYSRHKDFEDKYKTIRFGVTNYNDWRKDPGITKIFSKSDSGEFIAFKGGMKNNQEFMVVFPRFGLEISKINYKSGAIGEVFHCKGYNDNHAFSNFRVISPAYFEKGYQDNWTLLKPGELQING